MALLTPVERCDLAVVGAGIVGAMTAYLASGRHPDWTITMIDRSVPGRGATAYSLAVDIGYATSPGVARLVAESAPTWSTLAASMPTCFRALSAVAIVDRVNEDEWLDHFSAGREQRSGKVVEDRLRGRWPELRLSSEDATIAGLTARCATPMAVVESLVSILRQRGGVCWDGSEVTAVQRRMDGIELTSADGRRLLAARVVIALGPWIATGPWKPVADRLGIRIKKVVAMHLDIRPRADDPLVLFMADDAFLLPDPAGDRYLFSFASREWDVTPDPSQLRITPDDRDVALDILSRRLPGLERYWRGGRVFCDAYASDRLPFVSGLNDDRRICIATGTSGSGFRLSPGLALAALDFVGRSELVAETAQRVVQ